ncbi:MAG TPA: 16S rRNA (uracil(1498)-N(3))-methyltransferase [Armatimonadota bacterium]|jgi:16S rRNA (uracil1498-N3)-methyltransferase
MAQRFFVPKARFSEERISFTDEQRKQIRNVLRLRPGDMVSVFDGSGLEFAVRLESAETGEVVGTTTPQTESLRRITLVQGLPKGDKIEFIIQKCTEVGVFEFIVAETARSVPRIAPEKMKARLSRWNSIATEAAEQSGRVRVPEVSGIVSFKQALQDTSEHAHRVIAWESERDEDVSPELVLPSGQTDLVIFIGPEGGFTAEEVGLARESGVTPISLGSRILRTETAAVVASALAIYR